MTPFRIVEETFKEVRLALRSFENPRCGQVPFSPGLSPSSSFAASGRAVTFHDPGLLFGGLKSYKILDVFLVRVWVSGREDIESDTHN